ncbi:hypothetical protein [Kordiimonas marina]|uniref:hypothetical protein n=1 Tax=Kordiimonas marina TaxID=2872312 RepID=UPI001FF569D6|nr:hypothetical protein [Kordiimonas marina]MCJ9429977.1 hypothetical protein [Kordiimonas marina]
MLQKFLFKKIERWILILFIFLVLTGIPFLGWAISSSEADINGPNSTIITIPTPTGIASTTGLRSGLHHTATFLKKPKPSGIRLSLSATRTPANRKQGYWQKLARRLDVNADTNVELINKSCAAPLVSDKALCETAADIYNEMLIENDKALSPL